jgi:LmbE family N-acetylglucosaminyl deacetylase
MTRILTFPADSRLLVFAPHPDDETLATGELIQLALAAGAAVRVVFATDGDNNPWPQRWSERQWRIGPAERARWGSRRRAEARVALAELGMPAESARFLGWSDLGLTQKLEQDDVAIDEIAAEIGAYAPTHVAMPSLHDRHPDHGALRVMVELAIRKAHAQCVCLGYVVHGRTADSGEWLLPRDPERHRRKREALMAHGSQISLSRNRLLRWASQPESFEQVEPNRSGSIAAPQSATTVLSIPLLPAHRFWRRHDVLVVLVDGDRIERARVRLPRLVRSGTPRILGGALCSGRVSIDLAEGILRITVATGHQAGDISGYVKLERTAPRLLIFDVETWRRFEDFAPSRESTAMRVEPVAVAQRASL